MELMEEWWDLKRNIKNIFSLKKTKYLMDKLEKPDKSEVSADGGPDTG